MISRANITAWRTFAPWPSNEQVEQDLVLSRALVAMFSHRGVADRAVFRGGTAMHKLFFGAAGRCTDRIIECFQRYMAHDGATVLRAEFEANLSAKLASNAFLEDIQLLVPVDVKYDPVTAAQIVKDVLIAKLPGKPWRGSE